MGDIETKTKVFGVISTKIMIPALLAIFAGLFLIFLGLASNTSASELPTFGGTLSCSKFGVFDDVLDCRQAYWARNITTHQLFSLDVTTTHFSGKSTRSHFCMSRDPIMWNNDDLCKEMKRMGSEEPGSHGGNQRDTDDIVIGNTNYNSYSAVVFHLRVRDAAASMSANMLSRRVSIESFTSDESTIEVGESVQLCWDTDWDTVNNFPRLDASGSAWNNNFSVTLNNSGCRNFTPDKTGTANFALYARGPGGVADGDNSVEESRSLNVNVTVTDEPDLFVPNIRRPNNIQAGDSPTFDAEIENIGDVTTGSGFNVRFWVDGNNLDTKNTSALGGGNTRTITSDSYDNIPAGSYDIEVCVDDAEVISESDENNNCRTEGFTVSGQPDLVVSDGPSLNSGSLAEGGAVRFQGTVQNSGSTTASGNFRNRFRIDIDNNGSWDVTRGRPTINGLNSGASQNVISNNWNNIPAGTHRVELCADSNTRISESNENNNCSTANFTVTASPPESFTLNSPSTSCSGSTSRISLSWSASSNATSYTVYRNGSSHASTGGDRSYTDSSVSASTNYTYFIRASGEGGTTDSNSRSVTATWCVGDITVDATLNGSSWKGNVNYRIRGAQTINPALVSVPRTHSNARNGSYRMTYQSGGPSGASLSSYTPARTQSIPANVSSKPSIAFTLNFTSSPPTRPSNLRANNSTCGQIGLIWNDRSSNEDGFRVYRNQSGGTNLANYTLISTKAAGQSSHVDSPASGQSYYYAVTAFNAGGETSISASGTRTGPVFNTACTPNLGLSSMSIDQINGANYTGQTIQDGDTVKFRVVVSNTGTASAFDVYVDGTLTDNLTYAGNARLNSSSITASQNGQSVTFNSGQNLGDKGAGGSNWILTFDATANSSAQQSVDFFQATGVIRYSLTNGGSRDQSRTVTTGLTPFRTGSAQVPNIREVAP